MTLKDRVELAARLRAHVSTLAAIETGLPLMEWNDIARDFYEAADLLQETNDPA